MKKSQILKPQDVAILVKLLVYTGKSDWRQVEIAGELCLSQGEVAKSLMRLEKAGLVYKKQPIRDAALEFLIHAIKYVFPAEIGQLSVGIPTGISAPAHEKMVVQNEADIYVWPSVLGKKRGQMVKPLYPNLAEAEMKDSHFYDIMSAIEILRMGRSRERKLAEKYLEKKLRKV